MSNNISLRIFTPSGLEREEIVSRVTVPSATGEIEVLPGHAQYVGLLSTGILSYTNVSGGSTEKLVVSEGVCRFEGDSMDILADVVYTSSDALPDNVQAKKAEIERALSSVATFSSEWTTAKVELARIEALEKFRAVH